MMITNTDILGFRMNLTGQSVYQKGQKRTKANKPTQAQYARWERIRALGCSVSNHECNGKIEIHHIETKAGCKKNHDRVIPLCLAHHRGSQLGFHGIGSKTWQERYGTEQELMEGIGV